MKKIFMFLAMIAFGAIHGFSQSAQVVTAWNYIKSGEYEKGLEAINSASQDEKTKTWPKTWYYRGVIYQSIYEDSVLGKKYPNALDEAISSYKHSMDLGGKNEFKDQILAELQKLALVSFNNGVAPYNAKDYQGAYDAFKRSADLYQYINATFNTNLVDTLATLYTANAAAKLKKYDDALKGYQQLMDKGIVRPDIYSNMGEVYLGMKDTAKAIAIISEGVKKFPDDKGLMVQELNIYLFSGKYDEAIAKLQEAIKKDPGFTELYVELANMYEQKKDTANARKTYEQAIAIDPNNFDAVYRLGALYYNQAVETNNAMNKLDLNQQKQYDALKVTRDALFKRSLPYLEMAHKINPKDMDTMNALKELYARLNMMDKLSEIKKEIESSGG